MNIKINISEDAELRNYMKSQIQQQVKSIIRGELKDSIDAYIGEHVNSAIKSRVDNIFTNIIKDKVDRAVMWPNNTIQVSMKENIDKYFTEQLFKESIDKAIDQKIAKLILNK